MLTVGKRKLIVTLSFTYFVLALCFWALMVGKLSGQEFLQAINVTGLLVGGYLGFNVAGKVIEGKKNASNPALDD